MYDSRFDQLASLLVNHSTKIQLDERVLIEATDVPSEMIIAIIRAIRQAGGIPIVEIKQNRIQRELLKVSQVEGLQEIADYEAYRMSKVQAYIGIRGGNNTAELSDVPSLAMKNYQEYWLKPVHFDIRVPKTKWVVLRWPTSSMAQQAKMSTEAFEDFYFRVCTFDYGRMAKAIQPLQKRMEQAEQVRILGPETDLKFSIKNISAIPCSGECNIPDGECFTAPVRESVNGHISFNVPSIYQGTTFNDIYLKFENGKIVEASANNTARLNEILNTDDGSRYIGEFSIAFNPHIQRPMLDILFDEKISGSFHLTPGQAYEEADNGVRSSIHWDMVMIQRPEFGGGEIYFDEQLVRKDGIFVLPELEGLNPKQLSS